MSRMLLKSIARRARCDPAIVPGSRLAAYPVFLAGTLLFFVLMQGCFEPAPSRCLPVGGILNPGFECSIRDDGSIPGWKIETGESAGFTVKALGGARGMVAELSNDSDARVEIAQVVDRAWLDVQSYRARVKVSVQGEARAGMTLFLEGEKGTPFLGAENKDVEASGEWTDLETYAVFNDERGDHMKIVLWIEGNGVAMFDDVRLDPTQRDNLEDFDECQSTYECNPEKQACRFGHCVPLDLPSGELGLPDRETMAQVFEFAWQYASDYAPGFAARPELDWDEARRFYGDQVQEAGSLADFGGALSRMIMDLRDGHANLMVADACNSASAVVFTDTSDMACTTLTLDDQLVVYRSVADNPLGLVPGDRIIGYDGRDWKEIEQEVFDRWDRSIPCGSAFSSETSRKWAFPSSFLYNRYFFHETLEVEKEDGTIQSLDLGPSMDFEGDRIICLDRPGFVMPEEKVSGNDMWRQGPVISKTLADGKVVYATVRWMSQGTADALARLLRDNPRAYGYIFDVRYNRGGITAAFQPVWEALLDAGVSIPTAKTAQRDPLNKEDRYDLQVIGNEYMNGSSSINFTGKIAILTGPRAVSAGDVIPWMLAHIPDRVKRFGIATHGSFSGYFSNNQSIEINAGRYSKYFQFMLPNFVMLDAEDGSVLTGTDQEPEEKVWLTPEGLARGEDDVVEQALDWILAN